MTRGSRSEDAALAQNVMIICFYVKHLALCFMHELRYINKVPYYKSKGKLPASRGT